MPRNFTQTKSRMAAQVILAIALLVAASATVWGDDWPQFRGPHRNSISDEKGLLQKWPDAGPKLLWSATGIGAGFSHVTVAKGIVYVTGMRDKLGFLRAYTEDGALKWEAPYGGEWWETRPGARSIPTVHDGLVYIASGFGDAYCFDAATGRQVWAVKLFEKYEAPKLMWGFAESPLIVDDKVLFTPVGKKAAMVALDRKTGREIWTSPALDHESSYCSPTLVEQKGVRMIVTMTDRVVVAFSPADGSILWSHAYQNFRGNHCVTPTYAEGLLYVTSGYRKGAIVLQIADDGKSVKQLWEQPKQDPAHGQAVVLGGYVYAASHQFTMKWSCVELKTGKLMWEDACVGKSGSVICADGMLYCYSEDGVVGLVRPNPEKCEVVSRFKVPMGEGEHWAHPVVANGRLYIRHGDALMCYDVKAEAGNR